MELVTNKVVSDRWGNTRVPPNGAEMQSTQILRVEIVGGSGKIRAGGPGDDKVDLENGELTDRVWTGIVPLLETLGTPVPSEWPFSSFFGQFRMRWWNMEWRGCFDWRNLLMRV
jgi:hypothetical protein